MSYWMKSTLVFILVMVAFNMIAYLLGWGVSINIGGSLVLSAVMSIIMGLIMRPRRS